MKSRGLASPDAGDAFVMTFAVKVAAKRPEQKLIYSFPGQRETPFLPSPARCFERIDSPCVMGNHGWVWDHITNPHKAPKITKATQVDNR